MNQYDTKRQIQKCSIFDSLSNDDMSHLMQGSILKTIPSEQLIFSEHDCVSHYYFIISGQVNMFHYSPVGNEIIHLTRETDQLLIDPCIFFEPSRYSVNARAVSKVELHCLQVKHLLRLCEQRPMLSCSLIRWVAEQLSYSRERITQLSMNKAGQRLALYLYDLYVTQLQQELNIPVSLSVLANQLAITPETLSRLLRQFHNFDFIRWRYKKLSILDIEGLFEFVGLPAMNRVSCISKNSLSKVTSC